jgi:hypothetical protein
MDSNQSQLDELTPSVTKDPIIKKKTFMKENYQQSRLLMKALPTSIMIGGFGVH